MEESVNNKEADIGSNPTCSSNYQYEEGGRGCRNKRKMSEPICCPVCQVTLRVSEVQSHLTLEIDKLSKLPIIKSKQNGRNLPSSSNSSSSSNNDKPWDTYQKVRLNRQNRHRSKTRKRKIDEIICPICNIETNEEITLHVEKCLRRSEHNNDGDSGGTESDESIDVEAFEEYEWAGQSRIRSTTLVQGGVSTLGTQVSQTNEDEDLNVDMDDSQIYGSPQYSENDIYHLPTINQDDFALRKALTTGEETKRLNDISYEQPSQTITNPIIEVLKNRIKELENRENKGEIYKCLICMERYRDPVISVCCWHVHCEQCWLQTLGAKKLCPQCNMITTPTDLRRIYM